MKISRLVIKNFKSFDSLDVVVDDLCCVIGENNTGKSALIRAIQIIMDVSLPGYFRNLMREDIYAGVDISQPSQVLIGIELTDFAGKVNEEALVATWKTGADTARLFYRFRPRSSVRESIAAEQIQAGDLALTDYSWEMKGGGDPAVDLLDIEWDHEGIGESVRFSDLQSYLVISLQALRDVETDLKNFRTSPLIRLMEASEIEQDEQDALIEILQQANTQISESNTISDISDSLEATFKSVAGPAFEMDSSLGLSAATFQAILRNMRVLLSDFSLSDFEPARNGLGMNNILYVAILIEYFRKRIGMNVTAGQLLLIEEPEAHLHPQLQVSLLSALKEFEAQVILTSHSTQITSQAPFSSLVSLTRTADNRISGTTLSQNPEVDRATEADLERYLDATKSNLLFARKVMLVEGPAELFLIPALVKAIKGIDLERSGISVIPIHGVHFDAYTKLFRQGSLEKKCAVVADADLKPSDASDEFNIEENAPNLATLRSDFVNVFAGATTFEIELVSPGSLPMFVAASRDLGATNIAQQLQNGSDTLTFGQYSDADAIELLADLGQAVLRTAKRFGKARFAQVTSRYADQCDQLPSYIDEAVNWLLE